MESKQCGTLLVSCQDQPGIVAALSKFIFNHGGNIIESNQHTTDPEDGIFFIRINFFCKDLINKSSQLEAAFEPLASLFKMDYHFFYEYNRRRTAIFVSKEMHCLNELLWEWQQGDLTTDIVAVISNHEIAKEYVQPFNIPFYFIESSKHNRLEAERQQINILKELNVDLIILARYMQILTPNFVSTFPNAIINIHHSFLPAFIGANPYEKAFHRGVKLIGATSHYVTNNLDEGPIIEQDICRVQHHHNVNDLKKIGSTIERVVLSRAVKWHLESRILVHGNKTIVFS